RGGGGEEFLPRANRAAAQGGADRVASQGVTPLAAHAANLIFLKNVSWPQNVKSCGHAEGLCQSLTAIPPGSTGNQAYSGGPSADMVISQAVNPAGTDPICLYSASKQAYIGDRISFRAAGAGQVRSGDQNPYLLYTKLTGLTTSTPT